MIATSGFVVVPITPSSFFSSAPTSATSWNTRVCSLPTWSTTAPWNFSALPRLLRHRLQAAQLVHPRPLELGDRLPVGHGWRRFHQHERLAALHRAVLVMHK